MVTSTVCRHAPRVVAGGADRVVDPARPGLDVGGQQVRRVRRVNLRLFDAGPPITADERNQLLSRWHRVNRARLILLAGASVALERAAARRTGGQADLPRNGG